MIRLLIVDDHKLMRSLMQRLLRKTYHVATAANGVEALDLARATPFDIIYLDLRMPVLDGVGTLTEIRKDRKLRNTPVVILSGCSVQVEMKTARALGISGSLRKDNVTLATIKETTSRVLETTANESTTRIDTSNNSDHLQRPERTIRLSRSNELLVP